LSNYSNEDLEAAYYADPVGTSQLVAQQAAQQAAQQIASQEAQARAQGSASRTEEAVGNLAALYVDREMFGVIKEWGELRGAVGEYIAKNPHSFPDEANLDPNLAKKILVDIAKIVDVDQRTVTAKAEWDGIKQSEPPPYWKGLA
jgi:hypothetical protein